MRKSVWPGLCLAFVLVAVFFLIRPAPSAAQFFGDPLTATFTDAPPTIDGVTDDAWAQATPLISEVTGGAIGTVEVTLRAVYDAESVYFLIEWPDATESTVEGAEDGLAILWQITEIPGFEIVGCNQACHSGGTPIGMWFENESERADLWHWQALTTNPLGVLDDAYYGFSDGEEWYYADPGDWENGSRADVTAQGIWADGMWTLEIKRARDTGENALGTDGAPVDVTFTPGTPYFFGLAVMDATETDHSVADFAIGFIMEDGEAAPNAVENTDSAEAPPTEEPSAPAAIEREVHYNEVYAYRTTTPPTLDGVADDVVWAETDVSIIDVSGGAIRRVDVTMQAVYDDDNLYIVLQWPDDTESIDRRIWTYSRDGWQRGEKEDRFAILWQITEIEGFDVIGCNIACHSGEPPIGMWFNNEGEFGDLWNWKAARTNPMGYVDDGWMGPYSGHDDGGRYADPGLSSYARNETASGDAPGYIWADPDAITTPPGVGEELAAHFLLDVDAVPIDAMMAFTPGDTVPGYVLREPDGSRADIQARGVWADGTWTVEIMRALDTGDHALLWDGTTLVDVTFTPGETYYFSLVVMDNTDQDHSTEEIGIPFTLVD